MWCVVWTIGCMLEKMSSIRTRSCQSTKNSGGNIHKGHRGGKGKPKFHGRPQMLPTKFDWH